MYLTIFLLTTLTLYTQSDRDCKSLEHVFSPELLELHIWPTSTSNKVSLNIKKNLILWYFVLIKRNYPFNLKEIYLTVSDLRRIWMSFLISKIPSFYSLSMKNHTEYIALKIRKTVGYNCKTKTLCPCAYATEYSSIFNLSYFCGLSVCKSHLNKISLLQ